MTSGFTKDNLLLDYFRQLQHLWINKTPKKKNI